jgi:4-hydroxy-2-oxoglutarate aldolase
MSSKLHGIFPPIVTPFRDGEVDPDAIAHNLRLWNETGLAGYVALGSTGEFVHLSPDERARVIATVREHTPADRALIAGTGSMTTAETIRLTQQAAELGADAALVVTPFYYTGQMTDAALRAHFTAVADASPIPVLLYNVPMFTHVNMAVETIARLAEHPNIVGIKDSSGNVAQLSAIVQSTPEDFVVLAGSAAVLHPALTVGANGAILAVANVVPELCVEIAQRVAENDHATARQRQAILTRIAGVVGRYGIGGYKAAMELRGYRGGQPRRPLLPPDDAGREAIRRVLAETGFLSET